MFLSFYVLQQGEKRKHNNRALTETSYYGESIIFMMHKNSIIFDPSDDHYLFINFHFILAVHIHYLFSCDVIEFTRDPTQHVSLLVVKPSWLERPSAASVGVTNLDSVQKFIYSGLIVFKLINQHKARTVFHILRYIK